MIFVPTGNKYYKKYLLDATHRINMLKLLFQEYNNIYISDYEIKNTLVSTYQTLDYFRGLYPNDTIYFILGSDNLKEFHKWKNYKYLLSNYMILVIKRNSDDITLILKHFKDYSTSFVVADIQLNNLSSTQIRSILSKDNYVPEIYLHPSILEYIKENKLYIKENSL